MQKLKKLKKLRRRNQKCDQDNNTDDDDDSRAKKNKENIRLVNLNENENGRALTASLNDRKNQIDSPEFRITDDEEENMYTSQLGDSVEFYTIYNKPQGTTTVFLNLDAPK